MDSKLFWYGASVLFLVAVIIAAENEKKKIRKVRLPKSVQLSIPIDNKTTFNLKLKEQREEIENPEIASDDRRGVLVLHPADKSEHTAIYTNPKRKAEFTVTLTVKENYKKFSYFGNFFYKNKEYYVVPVSYKDKLLGDTYDKLREITLDEQKYNLLVRKPAKKINLTNDELEKPLSGKIKETYAELFNESNTHMTDDISNQRQGKQELITELLVIIDYSTYEKFLKFSKNNPTNAINNIKFYYSHLMNAVNDRYQRIKHNEFSWSTIVTTLYIARKASEAPFTSDPKVRPSENLLEGGKSLVIMDNWVKEQIINRRFNWPSFDLTVMFHELLMGGFLGLAYKASVCDQLPVANIKNSGPHETIFCTAHEIGHSMGSNHDETKDCLPVHNFIMAPKALGDDGTYDNELKFSPCSVKQFVDNMRRLNKLGKNCMLNKPSHMLQPMNEKNNYRTLPGQKYDLNQQCEISYGPGSSYCGGYERGDDFCKNKKCVIPEENRCYESLNFRVMDGTSCENRKWCIDGRCVADARAPAYTPKKCIAGESKAILYHSISNLTCALVKQKYTHLCYDQRVEAFCCKTCEDIKNKWRPNCLYGDKEEECIVDGCRIEDYRKRCCGTCQANANGCYKKDDKRCDTWDYGCETNYMQENCCNKCATKQHTKNGCSNEVNWCKNYVKKYPKQCQKADLKKTCCVSCR